MPSGIPTKKKRGPKGRSKWNATCIRKLEDAFSLDCNIAEACLYAGICEVTYYIRVKEDPELVKRFKLLRNKPVIAARQSVIKHMKEDGGLALKYLERKRKKEFSTKQVIESVVSTGKMSKKQSDRVAEILKANGDM